MSLQIKILVENCLLWLWNLYQRLIGKDPKLLAELAASKDSLAARDQEIAGFRNDIANLRAKILGMERDFYLFKQQLMNCLVATNDWRKRSQAIEAFLAFLYDTVLTEEDRQQINKQQRQILEEKRKAKTWSVTKLFSDLGKRFSLPKPATNASS